MGVFNPDSSFGFAGQVDANSTVGAPNGLLVQGLSQVFSVDFVIDNWIWIAMASVSGTMLFFPTLLDAGHGVIDPDAAVMLINREKAVVVDVCQPAEFANGHIPGSKNIPLDELEKKLPATVKNKSLPLILVCQSGIRSRRAVATAQRLGYERPLSLRGGIAAWRNANLPIGRSGTQS